MSTIETKIVTKQPRLDAWPRILKHLVEHGVISCSEIQTAANLAPTTLYRILRGHPPGHRVARRLWPVLQSLAERGEVQLVYSTLATGKEEREGEGGKGDGDESGNNLSNQQILNTENNIRIDRLLRKNTLLSEET